MNRLSVSRRVQVLSALVEGNSIRATCRMTGVAKGTVLSFISHLGQACLKFQNKELVDLPCQRVQCDEMWTYCYGRKNNLPERLKYRFGFGDVWVWVAICQDSKLVPCWHVGRREATDARVFIKALANCIPGRFQLTSDGFKPYIPAVKEVFGEQIDFAQLVKVYWEPGRTPRRGKKAYGQEKNPGTYWNNRVIRVRHDIIIGKPNPVAISTSYVERNNLTMRMCMRRLTRFTNGYSKKVGNLSHALAINFMYYNFVRVHRSINTSPAHALGLIREPWTLERVVGLL